MNHDSIEISRKRADWQVVIFLPAYNAAATLERVYRAVPPHSFDDLFLIDDCSSDSTLVVANRLGIEAHRTERNLGYGGNVKACLARALAKGGDIIIEMHPDGEYGTDAILPAIEAVRTGADLVLGNRFAKTGVAVSSGMWTWKYIGSVVLTRIHQWVLGSKIHDLHQGFRVYSRSLLERANYQAGNDGYLFSFEIIAQAYFHKLRVTEVPVSVSYTGRKRGASFKSSLLYSLATFHTLALFLLCKAGFRHRLFTDSPREPEPDKLQL